jgi:hypothetical protein
MSSSETISLSLAQTELSVSTNTADNMTDANELTLLNSNLFSSAKVSLAAGGSYCQLVRDLSNNYDPVDCSSFQLSQKTVLSQVAATGGNGREVNLDSSASVSVSFFYGSNQKLNVQGLQSPIDLWIPRSSSVKIPDYQLLNQTLLSFMPCIEDDVFLQMGINLANNNSIHAQFKPVNSTCEIGYVVLLKFGSAPKLNSASYDLWQFYCPFDKVNIDGDSFHLFFVNMSTTNSFKGCFNYLNIKLIKLN